MSYNEDASLKENFSISTMINRKYYFYHKKITTEVNKLQLNSKKLIFLENQLNSQSMFRILLSFLFIAGILIANAQTFKVVDAITNQSLSGVSVQVGQKQFSSDASGTVTLSGPTRDQDSLMIRNIGYQTENTTWGTIASMGHTLAIRPNNVTLKPVQVSASRLVQYQQDVPNKIARLSKQDVLFQNPQTTADLLNQSGEVYIQKSQQSGGSPMIRGFATNRVLLTVDDIRMNNAIFRSGNLQNVISLDAFATDYIDILFGPGSVIYGSDAIGGVMNFHTLTPTFSNTDKTTFKGNLIGRWSSANTEKTGHLDFSIGLKKWAFVTSISGNNFGDLVMGKRGPDEYRRPEYVITQNGIDEIITNPDPYKQIPTGYKQLNLLQKVRFKPSDNWDLQYAFHYSNSTDNPRYDNLIRYRNDRLRWSEWYYGPQQWIMNHLKITHNASSGIFDQVKLNLAYQHFEESRHERSFNSSERTNNLEKVDAFSFNLDFYKKFSDRHEINYGIESILNNVSSIGTIENIHDQTQVGGPTRYPDGSTWASNAVFMTYQYNASEKAIIQTGLRYNHFLLDANFDTTFYPFPFTSAQNNTGALTGSAGISWYPGKDWLLSTNISTGFRAPNIDDVGKVFESSPGSVVVPNPGLSSEYASNVDAGISKVFGSILKLNVTGFYTYLNNAMVRRDFNLNGVTEMEYQGELSTIQAIQNGANAKVYGFNASLQMQMPMGIGISSTFNYQHGTEELDNGSTAPLRHAAPTFGISRLSYQRKRLKTEFYVMYSGQINNDDIPPSEQEKTYMYATDPNGNPYSPSWTTLNLRTLYQLTDNIMVNAGLENITDKMYRPYSSGVVAAGRNFVVSMRLSL